MKENQAFRAFCMYNLCIFFERIAYMKFFLQYVKREIAKFFGVDVASEERERVKWSERQKRLALRRFGSLKQVMLIVILHLRIHSKIEIVPHFALD